MEIINATDGYKLGCTQKVLNKFTVIGLPEATNTFQKPLKVL